MSASDKGFFISSLSARNVKSKSHMQQHFWPRVDSLYKDKSLDGISDSKKKGMKMPCSEV